MSTAQSIRDRLRSAATRAMKERDRDALAAYRHALSGIDNAEAVVPVGGIPSAGALEHAATGLGAAEVSRRELSDTDIRAVVEAEIAEHRHAAETFAAHDETRADSHLRAARLLEKVLAD
jgi:uncharacterized protein YqeY